jgi:hypothetical protein
MSEEVHRPLHRRRKRRRCSPQNKPQAWRLVGEITRRKFLGSQSSVLLNTARIKVEKTAADLKTIGMDKETS